MKTGKNRIIFITGGTRSGKSSFALEKASNVSAAKAFIATAEALDKEMRERIVAHRRQRGNGWRTFEEPLKIAGLINNIGDKYKVVVLDCLTLWLSNMMTGAQKAERSSHAPKVKTRKSVCLTKFVESEIAALLNSLGRFRDSPAGGSSCGRSTLFIVSNEVGMGIVPDNALARRFRDMTGLMNRRIAEIADEVYFMVSGIPVKIKE
jgi:adenosylcobinamide kinase/adenosylcobinamide-phosphate guanylyltransferase